MIMSSVKESKNWEREGGDNEGGMAMSQLHRLNDITSMLLDMLSSGDQLPAWVQSKITRAYTDLNDVFGYLEPRADEEMIMPVTEGKRGLWDNVWARRRAGKKPKKPGQKGYPADTALKASRG